MIIMLIITVKQHWYNKNHNEKTDKKHNKNA